MQRPDRIENINTDVIIRGLPRSGTTALEKYINEHTTLSVHHVGKHRPLFPYSEDDGDRVHILKHPAAWLPSYVDYYNLEDQDTMNNWTWMVDKLHDWALRNRHFQDDAIVTVTHWEMVTDLEGMLERIMKCFPGATLSSSPSLKSDHAHGNGGFDPLKYTEYEYLEWYGDDALERLVQFLSSDWGEGVRDKLELSSGYWTNLAIR